MSVPKYFELENGDMMPRIGFGTWQASNEVVEKAVEAALNAGYTHIDTARAYENEASIGKVLKRWIGDSAEKRKELFIVTKLPPGGNRPERVEEYFLSSYNDLGLDYIDMYLMHVPFSFEHVPGDLHPKNADGSFKIDLTTDIVSTWKAMQKLKDTGKVRHLGVSNMNEEQLMRLCEVAKPECLQVEVHVLCQQRSLIAAANRLGIPIVAYSPLGSKALADMLSAKTGKEYPSQLDLPVVKEIANKRSRTPAQILLRFLLQLGVGAIPKSTSPIRIKQNINVWDFDLDESELKELRSCDRGEAGRICDFAFFPGADKHPEFPFKKL